MPFAEYLHRQAETCLRLARTTFDLTTAEKLRYMAADLRAKAEQLDESDTLEPHTISNGNSRNGSAGASNRN